MRGVADPGLTIGPEDFARAFDVSRETIGRLQTYEALLQRWQKTINLVAPSTLDRAWHRHFADSAQLLALAPPEAKAWVDLGSGAGFPGLVLGVMLAERPGARVTLIESDSRKAAFLSEVVRQTGAPVDILCMRIESAPTRGNLARNDVITARALAPMSRLLGLASAFVNEATICLFPKGREVVSELDEASRAWSYSAELKPSLTDAEARIAVIRQLSAKHGGKIP